MKLKADVNWIGFRSQDAVGAMVIALATDMCKLCFKQCSFNVIWFYIRLDRQILFFKLVAYFIINTFFILNIPFRILYLLLSTCRKKIRRYQLHTITFWKFLYKMMMTNMLTWWIYCANITSNIINITLL